MIENRLRVHRDKTTPLIEFYDNLGLLRRVEASGAPERVTSHVLHLIDTLS